MGTDTTSETRQRPGPTAVNGPPVPAAFRDSGGLRFESGDRMRPGLAFRLSGDLATVHDLDELGRAGVLTIVDLRSPGENRDALIDWAAAHDVRYEHNPMLSGSIAEIMASAMLAPDIAAGHGLLGQMYIEFVEVHGDAVARTLELIAAPGPIAFGCAAGKDRTGLVAAVLHVILGASVTEAAAAYADQAPDPERLMVLARAHLGSSTPAEIPPGIVAQMGTHPPAVVAVFTHLGDTYGGVEPWLATHHLAPGTVDALRAKLLEPAATL